MQSGFAPRSVWYQQLGCLYCAVQSFLGIATLTKVVVSIPCLYLDNLQRSIILTL